MIIGENRRAIIENIRRCVEKGDFNSKVEINDAIVTSDTRNRIIKDYTKEISSFLYPIKCFAARNIERIIGNYINYDTKFIGIEKIKGIEGGAIITCNHFNPLDSTITRKMSRKLGKRLYTVIQECNRLLPNPLGFLMNHTDTILLTSDCHFIKGVFERQIEKVLRNKQFVLMYPEQEMWFNYKKPRPGKTGAYKLAIDFGVPVISCFVSMEENSKMDNEEFYKVRYTLHVLGVIKPTPMLSDRQNRYMMAQKDYNLRKAKYEEIYGEELTYDFSYGDIAGFCT